jgi:hypothetical protein
METYDQQMARVKAALAVKALPVASNLPRRRPSESPEISLGRVILALGAEGVTDEAVSTAHFVAALQRDSGRPLATREVSDTLRALGLEKWRAPSGSAVVPWKYRQLTVYVRPGTTWTRAQIRAAMDATVPAWS